MSDSAFSSQSRPRAPRARAQLARFGVWLLLSGGLVALAGLLRLARQFPSASESPSLLVPFLWPVAALALEAGALVALSGAQLGLLLGATEQGAGRRGIGTAVSLGAALVVLAAAQLVPHGTEQPGTFANELIQSALGSCGEEGQAERRVSVPLLGLQLSCGSPRRFSGPMPGARSVEIAMSTLTFSDDLRSVKIEELTLDAESALPVHLHVGRATVVGLAPWSRSTRLGSGERFGVLALLALALWLGGALVQGPVARAELSSPSRWASRLASLLAGLPGVTVGVAFIVVDLEQASPWAFCLAALLGGIALALLRLVVRRVPRMFSSFEGF